MKQRIKIHKWSSISTYPIIPSCLEKEAPKQWNQYQVDSFDVGIYFLYFLSPQTQKNTHVKEKFDVYF